MTAYYNEHDPFAAAWLQNLIDVGAIAPGVVDTRSIEDVSPADLSGFTQCHFFAGIGGWSVALRQAGWTDDRPVWTGSAPCQPFSAAGKGTGVSDERHLWPAFHWLILLGQPDVIFGEQVSSKDGLAWLDVVRTDMENTGYAFGALDLCAAGVGAPHIRQRSYWMAHAHGGNASAEWKQRGREYGQQQENDVPTGELAHAGREGWEGRCGSVGGGFGSNGQVEPCGPRGRLAIAHGVGREMAVLDKGRGDTTSWDGQTDKFGVPGASHRSSPTNGFWRDADWLGCTDGKWRPVEPGTFPLAHGIPNRVGTLRGYGNAINVPLAVEHIKAGMDFLEGE